MHLFRHASRHSSLAGLVRRSPRTTERGPDFFLGIRVPKMQGVSGEGGRGLWAGMWPRPSTQKQQQRFQRRSSAPLFDPQVSVLPRQQTAHSALDVIDGVHVSTSPNVNARDVARVWNRISRDETNQEQRPPSPLDLITEKRSPSPLPSSPLVVHDSLPARRIERNANGQGSSDTCSARHSSEEVIPIIHRRSSSHGLRITTISA